MPTTLTALAPPVSVATEKLHLFSLYLDFPAAVLARGLVCGITQQTGAERRTTAEMWKLDALKSCASIRKMMTADAAKAEVIIIAATILNRGEPLLVEWLAEVAALNNRPSGVLIGLLGDENTPAKELDWVAKPLAHFAAPMGRQVLWHCPGQKTLNEANWPALKKSLARPGRPKA